MLLNFHKSNPNPNRHKVDDGFAAAVKKASVEAGDCYEIESEEYFRLIKKHSVGGLGDAVHAVANPIAKAIDSVFGTNLASCQGCADRRDALNKLI